MEAWIFSKPKSNKVTHAWVSVLNSFPNLGLFIHILFEKWQKTRFLTFWCHKPQTLKPGILQKKNGGGQVVDQEIQMKVYANKLLLHRFPSPIWCGGERRGKLTHIYSPTSKVLYYNFLSLNPYLALVFAYPRTWPICAILQDSGLPDPEKREYSR